MRYTFVYHITYFVRYGNYRSHVISENFGGRCRNYAIDWYDIHKRLYKLNIYI